MKRWSTLLAICLVGLHAQAVSPIPVTDFSYYSYSFVNPTPPLSPQILPTLPFPNQTTGSQDATGYCPTYASLAYSVYSYSGGVWTGPLTGILDRYYANLNATNGFTVPVLTQGMDYDISATGQIGSISDPSTQNYQQAWFWGTDRCYLSGPEFGFFKLFQATGANNVVNFYYSLNGNCFGVSTLSSCRIGATSIFPNGGSGNNAPTVAISIPSGTNSLGGTDWVYQAYASSAYSFLVRVRDPGTMADVVSPITVNVQSWFQPTMASLYTTGIPGFVTITSQRNSPSGGITDDMSSPLKLATYAVGTIMSTSPIFASGLGRLQGWCENGAQTVVVSSQNSTTRSQQSAPQCTVTVYVTGSGGSTATIYADSTGTPLSNPFTANASGQYYFYAQANTPHYDIQLSGGTPALATLTLGDNEISDVVSYQPHDVLAYPAGGFTGLIGVYNLAGNYTVGFTAPATLTQSTQWTLPSSDSAGCLESNGMTVLFFTSNCGPTGPGQSLQSNNGTGGFYGDANLTWVPLTQVLTATGIASTPAIRAYGGYVEGHGGFLSSSNLWNGYNSVSDGILVAGVHVARNAGSTAGAYVDIQPTAYAGNYPLPLNGLSAFGTNDALLWVSGLNQTPTPTNTNYFLNTNLPINAGGGFQTCLTTGATGCPVASPYNSFQAPNGGMYALSFTALNYVQPGSGASDPPVTLNDSFQQGALYYNTTVPCLKVYQGTSFNCVSSGGGGGGTPGTPRYSVQVNNPLGTFSGSSYFIWDVTDQPLSPYLKVTSFGGSAYAAIAAVTGSIQSDNGFNATSGTCVNYNCFNAPTGGGAGLSWTSSVYTNLGSFNDTSGPPTGTAGGTGGTINAGAIYYGTGSSPGLKYYTGSAWVTVSSGSGAPGGITNDVQINSSPSFGGTGGKFTYTTPSSHPLVTVGATAATAGINVTGGYVQSAQGFYAASCAATNCLNIPSGGAAATAIIATGYVQTGNQATNAPTLLATDTAHAGLMFYNTSSSGGGPCEMVYNGSAYVCLGAGGGGTPAGNSGTLQFNNAANFGGTAPIGMTTNGTTGVGTGPYLTFADVAHNFPFATNNVSLVNSGGSFFFLANGTGTNILVLDQAGDGTFTRNVQGSTFTSTANTYNSIYASGTTGGFLGATLQVSNNTGSAIQCASGSSSCGATIGSLDATGSGSLIIQALNGQIAGKDLYANDNAWNTIQAPSGGITAGTVISSVNFYASGSMEFGQSAPSSSNSYQFAFSNDLSNTLDLRDGSSNLIARVSSLSAPAYLFAMNGQGNFAAQSATQVPLVGSGYASGTQTGDLLDLTSNGSTIVFKVTPSGAFTANSAATLSGGLTTPSGTNSTLNIGTGNLAVGAAGHFYLQVQGLSSPSCTAGPYTSSGNDGYMYFDTTGSNPVLRACYNGSSYHVNLTTP